MYGDTYLCLGSCPMCCFYGYMTYMYGIVIMTDITRAAHLLTKDEQVDHVSGQFDCVAAHCNAAVAPTVNI